MDMFSATDRTRVAALLAEGYRLWSDSLLPELPYSERYVASDLAGLVYQGKNAVEFAAACQCFYLFRRLHDMVSDYSDWATLLGDYFFSQFSKYLIPLDSVPLIDSFSRFLIRDTLNSQRPEEYLKFVRSLPGVMLQ